ncbi:GspE/PulE family protein [Legionella jordanis]|uniref:Pilus assembly protein PilB n=1 Tax=Legionella jordanis TaxID=456 RepID=A0A0W0VAS7_9GAMM|nr:ATPase, T2SS/T4P/T4SS family [Legionella jordanis]KTD17208.1 pilus assembly protein PilB [Legionella jordanis]RMX03328.1 type IV-A pilus assembly ATPase PilB [Legionella jordanis]RMX15807.1 type IV-A pilus assembly ATPase PilB [Legionella jordanis]VEH12594.1 pilus assembly protein PilB [Legionella jordanis]HAT8713332.1 type IV-A pilus assembly ATPase PilB [Legionella jordanis]
MEYNKQEQDFESIAHLFIQCNLLTEDELIHYQCDAPTSGCTLLQYLINTKSVSAKQLALLISEHFGLTYIDLDEIQLKDLSEQFIDFELMVQHRLLPIAHKSHLILASDSPVSPSLLSELRFTSCHDFIPVIVETDKLDKWLKHQILKRNNHLEIQNKLNEFGLNQDASVIQFLDQLLIDAVRKKASDIHFELYEEILRIRCRYDGILVEVGKYTRDLAQKLLGRIKILANLDISEKRVPQDGRFQLEYEGNEETVDFRISICPTIHGEKMVIRILDQKTPKIPVEELGFNAVQKQNFLEAIQKPQGMILVTGPTGSGKTVTLYSALHQLNCEDKNISTAEDPVELKMYGINQVQVHAKAGLTFASILRALLRQDPDIIMIGEIRDFETAEIAMKAAQTGHLVFSTLHTNSAAESLTRLNTLGISNFNIANSVSLIVAQRLARRLCDHCKVSYRALSEWPQNIGKHLQTAIYRAVGCNQCNQGYHGRIGLFEVMPLSASIAELMVSGGTSVEIHKQAQKEGMITLFESGLEKIKAGLTSFEEIRRVAVQQ